MESTTPLTTTPTRDQLIAALNAKVLGEQNLPLGLLAGAGAALAGSLIWMGITVATEMHIGYVALGVGAAVGFAIRYAGKGVTKIFGIMGAIFTLLSCFTGEVLAVIQQVASAKNLGFFDVLSQVDFTRLIEAIAENGSPITYFIYAIGIYEGYKLSFRKLSPAEIQAAGLGTPAAPAAPVPTSTP